MALFSLTNRLVAALLFVASTAAATAADWDAGAGNNWKAVLAAAKAEGGVVAGACPELTDVMGREFKADTGLDITFLPGSSADIGTRLHTEAAAGRISMDVHLGGPSDLDLAKSGKFLALAPLLMLPNVTDTTKWTGGKLTWVDAANQYMVLTAEYLSSRPVINREIVDAASIKTWDDLLKPEFKGKIAAGDPTIPGAGQSAAAYISSVKGIDFVKRLYSEQQVTLSRDSRQIGEWAVRGLYPVILGMDSQYLGIFHRQGVDTLLPVTPSDGPGSIVGGCAVMVIPADAPHPNAAIVFLNWFLSTNGQHALVEAGHYPSLRNDLGPMDIVPELVPDPSLTYLNQYQEEWYLKQRVAVRDALKAVFTQ